MEPYDDMWLYDHDARMKQNAKIVMGLGIACIAVAVVLLALLYAVVCCGLDANPAIPEYRYRQMEGLILINIVGIAAMGCGLIHARKYYLDKIELPDLGKGRKRAGWERVCPKASSRKV